MQAQVRSGRSLAGEDRQGPRDVVVVGQGPVAVGVAAVLSERLSARSGGVVRMLDAAPERDPGDAFEGADAVVLVAHTGDFGAVLAQPPARRRAAAVPMSSGCWPAPVPPASRTSWRSPPRWSTAPPRGRRPWRMTRR
ncbi:hypothetical protein QUV83_15025 [Cellulomonas cellasea]|uniref:hypothetical protein n=1 Tax=Cellulomonas cellasea TaxID=43670 RepID=UPI0025A3DBF5|nr:hypothetical protein [Cellulomonas cellasea]MDM8086085.1 hypothetical protein [Cellulomonas cellasea]